MLIKIAQNLNINAIHERYVHDKAGVLFRIRFTIVSIDGVLQPQIISAEPVQKNQNATATQSAQSTQTQPLLANPKVADFTPIEYRGFFTNIVSPFTALDFLMSQPTRAPSIK